MIEHRNKLTNYVIDDAYPNVVWSFKTSVIFERLDLYINRLKNIRDMFDTANDFLRLEKLEIGGVRGRHLNQKLSQIQKEFQLLFNICTTIDYNPLDPNNTSFRGLKENYDTKTKSLERRIAQILLEGFENCFSTDTSLKLLGMIGKLAYRPMINQHIEKEIQKIVDSFAADVDKVEMYFEESYSHYQANSIEVSQYKDQ